MKNPFRFGPLVSGDSFYDRDQIGRDLYRAITNGENVLLYGPRRYGKSSLVARTIGQLRQNGHICLYFDMMKVNDLEHFLKAYSSAVLALQSRASKSIDAAIRFFKGLRPKITVGDDGAPALELDFSTPPTTKTLEDILSLPESLRDEGRNVVVVFDEFQEIGRISPVLPAERIFRSVIQRQEGVTYVFLGSRTHLIKRMFTDSARPFYQSALVLEIGKPPRGESVAFLDRQFRQCGIQPELTALEAAIDASENIPYYLQALAYEAFEIVDAEGRDRLLASDISSALGRAAGRMRGAFETETESLTLNQRTVLSALAQEPTASFDTAYRRRHDLPVYTSVLSALKVLVAKGIVEKDGKTHHVASPFLAFWLREPPYMTE